MATESRHILGTFENALQQLKNDIAAMASAAVRNLTSAIRGLVDHDDSRCNIAIADDAEVDRLEKRIDHEGMEIIIKFSPVAADLRRIISTMKVSSSLERVSDHAVSIAYRARKINKEGRLLESEMIEPLFSKAITLFNDAVRSFTEGNLDLALQVDARARSLDEPQQALLRRLTQRMEEDAPRIRDYIELTFVVRHLGRVGDQACNIAEDAVYLISAYDIRHGGERPVG